jgi:ribosomal protein S18 acetylase RimI-like enzyme
MAVRLRPAREADLERVGELVAQAYLADGLLSEHDDYVRELRDAAHRADEATVLVADDDGEVLGTVTVAVAGSAYAEIAQEGEAEIRMLAVDPVARGRGVGELLVRAAVHSGLTGGAQAVVLSTMPAMDAAQRMYERLGFERAADRDWPIVGQTMIVYRTVVPLLELLR